MKRRSYAENRCRQGRSLEDTSVKLYIKISDSVRSSRHYYSRSHTSHACAHGSVAAPHENASALVGTSFSYTCNKYKTRTSMNMSKWCLHEWYQRLTDWIISEEDTVYGKRSRQAEWSRRDLDFQRRRGPWKSSKVVTQILGKHFSKGERLWKRSRLSISAKNSFESDRSFPRALLLFASLLLDRPQRVPLSDRPSRRGQHVHPVSEKQFNHGQSPAGSDFCLVTREHWPLDVIHNG